MCLSICDIITSQHQYWIFLLSFHDVQSAASSILGHLRMITYKCIYWVSPFLIKCIKNSLCSLITCSCMTRIIYRNDRIKDNNDDYNITMVSQSEELFHTFIIFRLYLWHSSVFKFSRHMILAKFNDDYSNERTLKGFACEYTVLYIKKIALNWL